jgi:hypothetical protein
MKLFTAVCCYLDVRSTFQASDYCVNYLLEYVIFSLYLYTIFLLSTFTTLFDFFLFLLCQNHCQEIIHVHQCFICCHWVNYHGQILLFRPIYTLYRIKAVLKVETDIITSIAVSPTGQAVVLVIMCVKPFKIEKKKSVFYCEFDKINLYRC